MGVDGEELEQEMLHVPKLVHESQECVGKNLKQKNVLSSKPKIQRKDKEQQSVTGEQMSVNRLYPEGYLSGGRKGGTTYTYR